MASRSFGIVQEHMTGSIRAFKCVCLGTLNGEVNTLMWEGCGEVINLLPLWALRLLYHVAMNTCNMCNHIFLILSYLLNMYLLLQYCCSCVQQDKGHTSSGATVQTR